MSHDLLVAMRMRPRPDAVEVFARSAGLDLHVDGAFKTESNALVTRVVGTTERTIDVQGPLRAEPEDLPDDLAGVVSKPIWLVEIHLPGGYTAADAWAVELAIHLARVGKGAVFDPQADRVVWPSGVTPRARNEAEERIRTLELEWITPASALPPDAAARWLDVIAERFPPVTPVRFGSFEPFQGQLVRDGPRAFAEAWRAEASIDWGGTFFWSAKAPGLGGSVSFPDWREDRRPHRLGRVVSLSTEIDARPLYRDPAMCDAVVDLFAEVASAFGAVYAAGCVLRDAIMRRGRVSYDDRSEIAPRPRNPWWVGLPALPTWLAWFAPPYQTLVESRLDRSLCTVRPSGVLLRCGPEPMDVEELADVFPRLPAELLAVTASGRPVDLARRTTLFQSPPSGPAEVIPWLD